MVLLAGIALAAVSCFEIKPPVAEQIEITFLPKGETVVKVAVKISNPKHAFQDNKRALTRIEQTQRSFLEGTDAWARRFQETDLSREWFSWEKEDGQLVRVAHSGSLKDPEALHGFFRDTSIDVGYSSGERFAELAVYPGRAARAGSQQRKMLEAQMDKWISSLADYIAAVAGLYSYLEKSPDRAEICLGNFYEDFLSKERKDTLGEPSEEEDALLEAVKKTTEGVSAILEYPEDSEFSPDELSKLEYDPFPAPLAIQVPQNILEVEGFKANGENRVFYSGISFWDAFGKLEGKWHTPDLILPIFPYITDEKKESEPFDLDAFLALPRRAGIAPSRQEVRDAIEAALSPQKVYRVRWSTEEIEKKTSN